MWTAARRAWVSALPAGAPGRPATGRLTAARCLPCSGGPLHAALDSGAGQEPSEHGAGHHSGPRLLVLLGAHGRRGSSLAAGLRSARQSALPAAERPPTLPQVPAPPEFLEAGYGTVQFTLVDCPGHASLIRTIIGGAQIIDLMILVVDATKGECATILCPPLPPSAGLYPPGRRAPQAEPQPSGAPAQRPRAALRPCAQASRRRPPSASSLGRSRPTPWSWR